VSFDVDGDVLSDTARKTIVVYPTPYADFDVSNVCDGEEALLVSNTNANNSILQSWTWNFGDGQDTTIIGNEVNNAINHLYEQSGIYNISLMALTDLGCRDTAFGTIAVNPMPVISFVSDTNAFCGTGDILFTDSSTLESGSIMERYWNFGDGNRARSPLDTILHTYIPYEEQLNELFTVSLTATS
ncbi:PKD domain-containing protein, partial [Lentimicrobium sp. S6]|uniref:PKD domain-containing protein n=1 Tax=Lentimicrobium sp. S6 TaxID=2735872 RepID=UPI0015573799